MVCVHEISLTVQGRSQERLTFNELKELFGLGATARRPKARTTPASKEDGEELGGRHEGGRVPNSEARRERGESWQGQVELYLRFIPEHREQTGAEANQGAGEVSTDGDGDEDVLDEVEEPPQGRDLVDDAVVDLEVVVQPSHHVEGPFPYEFEERAAQFQVIHRDDLILKVEVEPDLIEHDCVVQAELSQKLTEERDRPKLGALEVYKTLRLCSYQCSEVPSDVCFDAEGARARYYV